MRKMFKNILWVSICCVSFAQVGRSEEMSKKELSKRFEEMRLEYYKQKDPLRYQFYTRTGKFENKVFPPQYELENFLEYLMYKSAGAVYGKVEKKEGCPFYSVAFYIKPYIIFKDVVLDTNGYVVAKEGRFIEKGKNGEILETIFADREQLEVGEEVIVFLNDIPAFRLGMDTALQKKILETKKLPVTTEEKYYECFYLENGWASTVKNDTVKMGSSVGRLAIPREREKFIKPPLSEAINIMKKIEKEYEEELKK